MNFRRRRISELKVKCRRKSIDDDMNACLWNKGTFEARFQEEGQGRNFKSPNAKNIHFKRFPDFASFCRIFHGVSLPQPPKLQNFSCVIVEKPIISELFHWLLNPLALEKCEHIRNQKFSTNYTKINFQ